MFKGMECILGSQYIRLTVKIKGSVEECSRTSEFYELGKEVMVVWIIVFGDYLRSNGEIIGMHCCRKMFSSKRSGIESDSHIGGKDAFRVNNVFLLIGIQHAWSKRHPEITVFDGFIEDTDGVGIIGTSQNGTIA